MKADRIIDLLRSGVPYRRIAAIIGCSKSTIAYHAAKLCLSRGRFRRYDWQRIQAYYEAGRSVNECMTEFGFSRRAFYRASEVGLIALRKRLPSASRAGHVKGISGRRAAPDFIEKTELSSDEQKLKWYGLGLYCGEGDKRGKGVGFTNSNPAVITQFLTFLRRVFHVRESRLRVILQLKDFHNVPEMTSYWSRTTGVPESQFGKAQITKSNPNKNGKPYMGTCLIRYGDQKLQKRLLELIDQTGAALLGGL